MKKGILLILLLLCLTQVFSQENKNEKKRFCTTFGILQGGGSLIGADLEILVSDRIGFQIGGGYSGLSESFTLWYSPGYSPGHVILLHVSDGFSIGGALNFHLKPSVRSSFISLSYRHQGGTAESFNLSAIGLSFVWRAKKIFTAQAGLGIPFGYPPDYYNQPKVMLLFSLGAYIPW